MDITTEQLKTAIAEILEDADLSQLSAKKVRKQLEAKFDVDLTERKKEVDKLLMKEIEAKDKAEEQKKKEAARKAHEGTNGKKAGSEEDDSDSDIDLPEDIDEPPVKKQKKTANKASESDSDESDDEKIARRLQAEEARGRTRSRGGPAKKSPKKAVKKSSGPRKSSFSAEMKLSPTLASVMGTDTMRRSDVVKRMWEIIKERGLQDPKNRQFMVCDEELLPLFGKKRVKTFGMMKHLSEHIFKPEDYEQMFTTQ